MLLKASHVLNVDMGCSKSALGPYLTCAGTECSCGTVAPTGAPIYHPAQPTVCAGNPNESCGAPGYAIVYSNLPRSSGPTSTVAQTPAISGQPATEANPVGSPTVIPYTSILPNGSTIIGFTSAPIPAASAPYTSILPDGSTVTISKSAGIASSVAPYTSILPDRSTVTGSKPARGPSSIPLYTSVLPGGSTVVISQPAPVSPTFAPQTSVLPGGSTFIGSVPTPIASSSSFVNGGSSMIPPSANPVITRSTNSGTAPVASATVVIASDGLPAASETAIVTSPGGTEVPVVVYSGVDFPGADLPAPGGAKRLRKRAYTGNSIEDCMTECVNHHPKWREVQDVWQQAMTENPTDSVISNTIYQRSTRVLQATKLEGLPHTNPGSSRCLSTTILRALMFNPAPYPAAVHQLHLHQYQRLLH